MEKQNLSVNTQLSFGGYLDRWLLKKGFKFGWPLTSLWLIELRRKCVGSLRVKKRDVLSVKTSFTDRSISREEGYRLFGQDLFPQLPEIVVACNAIFNSRKSEIVDCTQYNKPYFYNILTPEDLCQHPVLIRFALSPAVIDAVSGYLGQTPRLHSMGVFYTEVNDSVAGSQMYHVDGDALSQVKCFVNIWEVGVGSGPFTFLPKRYCSHAVRNKGLLKLLSDDEVANIASVSKQVEVIGMPGSGVFVDTSQCLHQGSRARENSRLVFQFQYITRPDALLDQPGRMVKGGHLLVSKQLLSQIGMGGQDLGVL